MRMLERKLVRDLARMKGQALSIGLVVACGVALFVASLSTYGSLRENRRAHDARTRFADVFASLKRAPEPLARRIAGLPGVATVETRIVQDVILDMEELPEPAVGRFVSIPAGRQPLLNRLHVRSGRLPEPGRSDEVLVNESFATWHGLGPGDSLVALLNGRRQRLRVVGVALSPEYIVALRPGSFLPDDAHFGVMWMEREALAAVFDMKGSFNDVVLALSSGASEPEVLRRLDALLAPYGGRGAYGRKEQPSYRYVEDELEELRVEATVLPVIFLAVAAFLLHIVVGRLVHTERTRIGTLKALGYGSVRVGLHYLEWMGVITLAGALVGIAVGVVLGRAWAGMYSIFFHFPETLYLLRPWIPLAAVGGSLLASMLGTLGAVQRVVRLAAAEAMQPPAPPVFRPSALERLLVGRLSSPQARMVVRSVARRPLRSALSALGVAAATAIILVGAFWSDAIGYLLEVQFSQVQREDVTVAFTEPVSERAERELRHLPGVTAVEGLRAVPVLVRAGGRSRRVELLGLPARSRLHPLWGSGPRPMELPPEGLMLSERLATLLGVRAGERVRVQVLEGAWREESMEVAGVVDEYVGLSAYMEVGALNRLMAEGPTLSAALLKVDPRHEAELYARLKDTPAVGVVTLKHAMLRVFDETFGQVLLVFSGLLTAFGAVIAFGVVYNGARILLAEKERELASLRVLGFTRREISARLLGELGLQVAVGIPVGLVLGYGLAAFSITVMGPETLRIPLIISPRTYALVAGAVMVSGALSALLVRRRLDRLDLVAVLKMRE
ncbi:MAG: ABC transporter permease [Myxococcaceae bacterium]|nr:ABC transporter permease [Myxococcaceae bacterium]